MDKKNSEELSAETNDTLTKQENVVEEGSQKAEESDTNEGERRDSVMSQSKRIRKLSVEEVDLVKKYRKGREKNTIKVRQMRKSTQNLRENFKAIKENMISYLDKIEGMLEERCTEIEGRVTSLENECIIPEIEEIKNTYEANKSKDEDTFNQQLLESHLNEQHMDILSKLMLCKKNVSGDFDSIQTSKATIISEYIQQVYHCLSNLHDYAESDQSQLQRSLKCVQNINYLKLLQRLREKTYIKSDIVESVMLQVERGDFAQNPYEDRAQQIGFNTTVSAPHMHACTLEMLKDHAQESMKCLDIGIGSGWMTTALAVLMKDENSVCYGIDHLQGVLNIAKKNISKNHKNLLESGRIVLVKGDGREGLEDYAPFDIIHLGAAATLKAVSKFIHQLAPNGILCGPIIKDHYNQEFMIIKKDANGQITKQTVLNVTYGSLVAVEEQYQEKDEEEYYENEDDTITFQQQVIHVDKKPECELDDEENSDQNHEDDEEEDEDHSTSRSLFFRNILNSGRSSTSSILNRLSNYQDAIRYLFQSQNQNSSVVDRVSQQTSNSSSAQQEQQSSQQSQQAQHENSQQSNSVQQRGVETLANQNINNDEHAHNEEDDDLENDIFDEQPTSVQDHEYQQLNESQEEINQEQTDQQPDQEQDQGDSQKDSIQQE